MKTLTIVVPCYNSAAYMRRTLDSLLPTDMDLSDLEVLIVDDGSWDATAKIAEGYQDRFPGVVSVIRKKNGGHGSAINTGLEHASGLYLKIVDSDDWLDETAFAKVMETLRGFARGGEVVDLLVSNFVYEKEDRRRRSVVRYKRVLPEHRVFGWKDVGRFGKRQYMLMHSLIYRTDLLRECGLRLPEHTFYVDNLYALAPLPHVHTLFYLDVDLYRYYIGREDQSVNERVMLSRVDQQVAVNRAMFKHLDTVTSNPDAPRALRRYMLHYVEIVSAVTSILLLRAGTKEACDKKYKLWADLRQQDVWLYRRLRRSMFGQIVNLPGRSGRYVSVLAYKAAQWAVGFN